MKVFIKLFLILIINICYSSSIYSLLSQNALYFSSSNYFDTVDVPSADFESNTETSVLTGFSIGYVNSGKYDFSINYINNKSKIYNYHFPANDKFVNVAFKYNITNLEKLPFFMQVGFEYNKSIKEIYNSTNYMIMIYKEYNSGKYPVIPFINLSSINCESSNYVNCKDKFMNLGLNIKLTVDTGDNSLFKDILFISPSISTYDFSQYFFGLSMGLYHPFE